MDRRYSSFFRLGKRLFAQEPDLFAMFIVYFDDSGTSPTDPVAVVAGYLATASMWEQFEKR